MTIRTGGLRVLGVDARHGRPIPPLSLEQATERARDCFLRARPPRYGVRSGCLGSAGWGVVFTEQADPLLREALEPLLKRRQQQARDRYYELEARPGDNASRWREALFTPYGRADPRQIPWYLLIVGDPTDLPFHFEQDLGSSYATGRLAFGDPEDFAAYAQRVVASEEARGGGRMPRVGVFAPTHPDDPATQLSLEHFAHPVMQAAIEQPDGIRRPLELDSALGPQAKRARLETMIAAAPDVLVAAGHGLCYVAGDEWQRQRQGSLVCADWPGPLEAPRAIEAEESLAAADLPSGALARGVAILLGCYTAGTPTFDLYDELDLNAAKRAAPEPFVSAMANRLLGRQGGALAVLGHVGRAFEAGFYWRGARQSAAFEDAVRALLDGRRLGEALDGLGQRYADLAIAWTRPQLEREVEELDPLDLWVAMNDARSWALLGDPAIRLPVTAMAAV